MKEEPRCTGEETIENINYVINLWEKQLNILIHASTVVTMLQKIVKKAQIIFLTSMILLIIAIIAEQLKQHIQFSGRGQGSIFKFLGLKNVLG